MSGELTAVLPGGGHVLFSSRAQGNMSSVGGQGAEHGAGNRERLRAQLGLRALARGYQVHGTKVERVTVPPPGDAAEELPQADGQATALTRVGAMVMAADCLPVALGAPRALAMVHAGWRGLAAGVLENGVRAVRGLADDSAAPLTAVIGPCAGPCCYEVGPEVHAALGLTAAGKARIDLPAIARRRLQAAGVTSVAQLAGCTICDERFFSYRREGHAAGRNIGVAWRS